MQARCGAGWMLVGALGIGGGLSVVGMGRTNAQQGSLERARELFALQCAVCHGPDGRGDGTAAYLLSPAPRDFGSTRFRIVSTVNGVPTDEDLAGVIQRGMPGSAMPPFEWIEEGDRQALAKVVRELAIQGRTQDLLRYAAEEEEEMPPAEALEIATRAMTPGASLAVPPECAGNDSDWVEGRRVFLAACAQCHGADGTGASVAEQFNEDGTPASPRDFTAGIFKGGSAYEDIACRLLLGLPGSSMPATQFTDSRQAAQVAAYVRSLARPGAQERVAQVRRTITARRVRAVPSDASDPAWAGVPATWLPLMPLWWHEPRVEGCLVRAVHNGERLALKVSWEDASRDEEMLAQDAFSDALALQWSLDATPPLFTMGEAGRPVNIWQWKAGWELDLAGVRDVVALHPYTPPDQYAITDAASTELYLTGRAAGNPMAIPARASASEALFAEGFGTLAPIPSGGAALQAKGKWDGGHWDVVVSRPLAAKSAAEIAFAAGSAPRVALAVWNGAAQERNGQKSVTVWHVLELEK